MFKKLSCCSRGSQSTVRSPKSEKDDASRYHWMLHRGVKMMLKKYFLMKKFFVPNRRKIILRMFSYHIDTQNTFLVDIYTPIVVREPKSMDLTISLDGPYIKV